MKITHARLVSRALLLSAFIGAALAAGAAEAGKRSAFPLTVSLSGRYAYGTLSSTRGSSDVNAKIGCSLNSDGSIYCTAEDATASQVPSCSVYAAPEAMQRAVANIKGDSYVYFTWDASWQCTYIFVQNSSEWAPKPL